MNKLNQIKNPRENSRGFFYESFFTLLFSIRISNKNNQLLNITPRNLFQRIFPCTSMDIRRTTSVIFPSEKPKVR